MELIYTVIDGVRYGVRSCLTGVNRAAIGALYNRINNALRASGDPDLRNIADFSPMLVWRYANVLYNVREAQTDQFLPDYQTATNEQLIEGFSAWCELDDSHQKQLFDVVNNAANPTPDPALDPADNIEGDEKKQRRGSLRTRKS